MRATRNNPLGSAPTLTPFIATCILCLFAAFLFRSESQATIAIHPNLLCEEPLEEAHSVVLFLHGLNNSPTSLRPLRSLVRENASISCQLRLHGHTAGQTADVGLEKIWRQQTLEAIQYVKTQYPEQRLYALGYSLGGALLLDSLQEVEAGTFDGLILLAPAVTLSWKAAFLRILTPLRALDISLPSFAPRDYRVHDSTSLLSYHATLQIAQSVREKSLPAWVRTLPIILAVSSKDELLDSNTLQRYFAKQKLKKLRILLLEPQPTRKDAYEHLIIDSQMLGESEWSRLRRTIRSILRTRDSEGTN